MLIWSKFIYTTFKKVVFALNFVKAQIGSIERYTRIFLFT